jgi:hypothetical protein
MIHSSRFSFSLLPSAFKNSKECTKPQWTDLSTRPLEEEPRTRCGPRISHPLRLGRRRCPLRCTSRRRVADHPHHATGVPRLLRPVRIHRRLVYPTWPSPGRCPTSIPSGRTKIWNPLRSSHSKVPYIHLNTARKEVQPTMECKSMKVMSKTKMHLSQSEKAYNQIRTSHSKAPYTN